MALYKSILPIYFAILLIIGFLTDISSSYPIEASARHLTVNGKNHPSVINDATAPTIGVTKASSEDSASNEKSEEKKEKEKLTLAGEDVEAPALFKNHKDFGCLNSKIELHTGNSATYVYPGDIGIVAALGDGISTGRGLWSPLPLEYRGATFSLGGDASLDDLISITNIIHEFNSSLIGASHGMGTAEELPENQLNMAETGATSENLLDQANELVERLSHLRDVDLKEQWVMPMITIGTEELCATCQIPNVNDIKSTLDFLRDKIPKALVVIVGPVNYWSHFQKTASYLRGQCPCFKEMTEKQIQALNTDWRKVCTDIEQEYNNPEDDSSTFGVIAVPVISMPSDQSSNLFVSKSIHFNLKGHQYAAKYLWNRLMTGRSYNVSSSPYKDELLCPSLDCPYFRTLSNARNCKTLKHTEVTTTPPPETTTRFNRRKGGDQLHLYITAASVVAISFCTVFIIGTILYRMKHQEDSRMGA